MTLFAVNTRRYAMDCGGSSDAVQCCYRFFSIYTHIHSLATSVCPWNSKQLTVIKLTELGDMHVLLVVVAIIILYSTTIVNNTVLDSQSLWCRFE